MGTLLETSYVTGRGLAVLHPLVCRTGFIQTHVFSQQFIRVDDNHNLAPYFGEQKSFVLQKCYHRHLLGLQPARQPIE